MLVVTSSVHSGTVDLTTVGVSDWIHYGLTASSTVIRKAVPLITIPTYVHIGTATITRSTTVGANVSWTDGTPTAESAGTATGIYKTGDGFGYRYVIPTAVSPQRFNLYLRTTATAKALIYLENFSESWPAVAFSNELANLSVLFSADIATNLIIDFTQVGSGNAYIQACALFQPNELYLFEIEGVSIGESVSWDLSEEPGMLYYGVNDATSLAESVAIVTELNVSSYEAVSAIDWTCLGGERMQLVSNLPTWGSTIEMSPAIQISSVLPLWEASGRFGLRVSSDTPVHEMTALMQEESISLSIKSDLPLYSMSSSFGFRLLSKLPVLEFTGSFSTDEVISLVSNIPLHVASLTLSEEGLFEVSSFTPSWQLSATLSVSEEFALRSRMPVGVLKASLIEEGSFSIESNLPGYTGEMILSSDYYQVESDLPDYEIKVSLSEGEYWTLVSKLPCWYMDVEAYDPSMQISSDLPVWYMGVINDSFADDDGSEVDPLGSVTEDSFTGVLRYVRP